MIAALQKIVDDGYTTAKVCEVMGVDYHVDMLNHDCPVIANFILDLSVLHAAGIRMCMQQLPDGRGFIHFVRGEE